MALYTFHCADCGVEFEKMFARISTEPKADCPSCGSHKSERGFDLPAKSSGAGSRIPETACPTGTGPCGTIGCRRGS